MSVSASLRLRTRALALVDEHLLGAGVVGEV
jgi:hypothetical protein